MVVRTTVVWLARRALAPGTGRRRDVARHRVAHPRKVELAELATVRWVSVNVGFPVDDELRSLVVPEYGRMPCNGLESFGITEALMTPGHKAALLPRYTIGIPYGKCLLCKLIRWDQNSAVKTFPLRKKLYSNPFAYLVVSL